MLRSKILWFAGLMMLTAFGACSTTRRPVIQTTEGPVPADSLGLILPHEHIFTDLRGPDAPGYGDADVDDVVRVMAPRLLEAKQAGVALLVECSSIGVGRNVPVLVRLARETGLHIVAPTGVYGRDQYAPSAYRQMSQGELARWMIEEITEGIEGTDVKAGFIKVAASDAGLTDLEERILRAAAQAARETGVVIASHTANSRDAVRQADILEEEGLPLDRFIWVHAQATPDAAVRRGLGERGVYLELDSIGSSPQEDARLLGIVRELQDAGLGERILLSHDAGWYQPGEPDGGSQRGYTALVTSFVPALREAGLDEGAIRLLTVENPRRAFALQPRR